MRYKVSSGNKVVAFIIGAFLFIILLLLLTFLLGEEDLPDDPPSVEIPDDVIDKDPIEVTITEALVLDDAVKVIVRGKVKEIHTEWTDEDGYISVIITDGENDLYVFKLATKVELGDTIIVTGEMDTDNGERQIAEGATAVIESKDPDPDPDPEPDPDPDPEPEPERALLIELTTEGGFEDTPFNVENMLPGDKVTKYYCASVTHEEDVTVSFGVAVDKLQKLCDVVRIKIEHLVPSAADVVIYDGLLKDCVNVDIDLTADGKTTSRVYYSITVYTNGAEVGNEYAGESLTADFIWQAE